MNTPPLQAPVKWISTRYDMDIKIIGCRRVTSVDETNSNFITVFVLVLCLDGESHLKQNSTDFEHHLNQH